MNHNKAKKAAKILALVLAAILIISSFSFVVFLPGVADAGGYVAYGAEKDDSKAGLDDQLEALKEVMIEIQQNYKDEVSYKTLLDGAFNGMFESLDDPFSAFYGTVEEGDQLMESLTGEFSGIGVSIESDGEFCRIASPIPGTPAEAAGMRTGDIITMIDGVSVSGKTLSEIGDLLKGPEGSKVTVSVQRGTQIMDFPLTREKIKMATVNGRMLDNRIGYIQIRQFAPTTSQEFKAERLKLLSGGMKSLIIDVRGNPGGVLSEAVGIAGQLMPEAGPIAYFVQQGKIVETVESEGSDTRAVPTVILVNEGSASATEALAGALQDSRTAAVVGTTTYGKGVAQQVVGLKNGSSFKLSMFYFLTPGKHQIDGKGITPDYVVYNGLGLTEKQIAQVYADLAPMTEKIKYGVDETGLNVYGAQQRLAYMGYDVKISGTMDGQTVAAIKKFQKEQGFSDYGGLDYTTMKALSEAFDALIGGGSDDKQLAKAIELLTK